MFKKILSLALVVLMLVGCVSAFASCSSTGDNYYTPVAKEDIKVGLICLHDENSTYDKNFIDAMKRTATALGLDYDKQIVLKTNIPESDDCYKAACELADAGCQIIFADSFGHEDFMIKAAAKYPKVQFCHASGTKAITTTLSNYHNAFAAIYQGRYVAGIIGGIKLAELYNAGSLKESNYSNGKIKIGYVGAFPYAEVVSGYTGYYLGVKEGLRAMADENLDITMDVQYTNSWYDEAAEKEATNNLISRGCALISQHADSMGAPTACETAGVPNVSYNGSTAASCPKTFLVSSYIDWDPYYQLAINAVMNGVKIQDNYCGGIAEGSVKLTDYNKSAFSEESQAFIDTIFTSLKMVDNDDIVVFDIDNFTVNGKKVTTYKADVISDDKFTPDTEAIFTKEEDGVVKGFFQESKFRSAPYFDLRIDGITELNAK